MASRLALAGLAAAEQEACPLLTHERNLRNVAEAHGTLWVAERLVASDLVTVDEFRAA